MTSWKKLSNPLWFRAKGIIPSARLLFLLFIHIVVTAIGAWWGWGWLFFSLGNGVIFGLLAIDLWLLRAIPTFSVTRKLETIFELHEENKVELQIKPTKPTSLRSWVQDDYPHGFQVDQRTFKVKWNQEPVYTISYIAKPHRRGKHLFRNVHIRTESVCKLFLLQQTVSASNEVKVYPQLESVRKVRNGFYKRQPFSDGTPITRTFGAGREFSHIREYIADDDPRNINWMGTARQGKLVSNVYQPEVGQQVAILLDCGRLMGVQNDGKSQLDQALEAALGFAAIALQRGDRVCFLAFSNQVLRWVPLGKGISHLQQIIESCYDLEPAYIESNYLVAWEAISLHTKSKTLITLFTDITNIAFSETISPMIARAKRKHLVMTVSMQDSRLKQLLDSPLAEEEEIYQQVIVEQLQQERKQALEQWGSKKVVTLDVEPERLASAVIYSYLEIRNRMLR